MYRDRFKKINGEKIDDIIEYIRSYLIYNETDTISIGCDSKQDKKKTAYAITIMLHSNINNIGAHVLYFREYVPKIKDINERLYKEAKYLYDVGMYINSELSKFYERKDLTEYELKRYKYHLAKCDGKYEYISPINESSFINNLTLTNEDNISFNLVDIHVDFNPFEKDSNGLPKNKSNVAYKSYAPWLRSLGFRTWAKPMGFASTSAADLLIKNI